MPPDVRVADREPLVSMLAQDFGYEARGAIGSHGFFAFAVPGGSVAAACFPRLATLPLDWSRLRCFWADERSVPPADPESNYGMARELLLKPAGVPAASIHRMPADISDLDAAAAAYTDDLVSVLGPAARLDYALLGVGPDGHIASLFPNHPALACEDRLVAAVADAPKPPPRRLTLTLPVLAHASRLAVMAFGEEKAGAIREAIEDPGSSQPLARLLRRASRPLVLIDRAAAALIGQRA